jgi:hypothetical protein
MEGRRGVASAQLRNTALKAGRRWIDEANPVDELSADSTDFSSEKLDSDVKRTSKKIF